MYDTIINYMKNYEYQLEQKIVEHRREIRKLPDGKLCCFRNRQYYTWYRLCYVADSKVRELIPKSNRKLAEQLALKGYYEQALAVELKQLRAVKLFLKYFINQAPGKSYLTSCSEHMNLLGNKLISTSYSAEQLEWMYEERPQKQPFENELTASTVLSYDVRSKAESDYVSAFVTHHIVFRYEWPLYLSASNKIIFPDFTVKHPITGETVYIEHFGSMDDPGYVESTAVKFYQYVQEGILPGKNLFFSYETRDKKFTSFDAEQMVRKLFVD